MKRKIIWILALLLLAFGALAERPTTTAIALHHPLCSAVLGDGAGDRAVMTASYRCGAQAPTDSEDWLWLRLDTRGLGALPAGWQLLVDQTRFDELAILSVGQGGASRSTWRADALAGHWAPGGMLRFDMAPPGREVRALYLGFRRIDDLSLMRKVGAVAAPAQAGADTRWLLLMGIFAGTMLSALLYNVVINTGRRHAFQRWYLLWVAVSFAYGMTWTNMSALLLPDLVGPWAVRVDFVLVGLMVAAGNMFFYAVIERGMVPRGLMRTGRTLAVLGAALGVMAALDHVFPPVPADRWLNYVIAVTAVTVALSCVIAVRRGSRVVWFYLLGWGPVIFVFVARLVRNLGLTAQNDLIDMATFAALAFEALVLSLAIADRFRRVQRELDDARQRRAVDHAEARTLRHAAQTDFLTGLGNRAAFHDAAGTLADRGTAFDLYLIDVDFLKDVNDRLGHGGGDALLRLVGEHLAALRTVLPDLHCSRIGGDEFAILCPGGPAEAELLTARLDALQGIAWRFQGRERSLSLSIGRADFPADAADVDQLYQNADLALYSAKRLGRAQLYRYDPLQRILRDLQTEFVRDADAALRRDEFCLHYQPIVDIGTGAVRGYAALLRWDHPRHGLLPPDRFADVLVAERVGLRVQEHVLDLALRRLQADGDRIGQVALTFTAAQLAGSRSAEVVLDRLARYGVPPARLCIEITESVLLDRAADVIAATLQRLHAAGVCIALDGFGTGAASLAHLRRLPIDRIKLDRSFVAGLDGDSGGTLEIVRAIVGLGRGLRKIVVAEGVETQAQALVLRDLGCDLAQGLRYGRPALLPDAVVALEDRPTPRQAGAR
ncbi:putative bifunctional diguanylate cyclase/phosphodiesterase [Sphingomonas sp. Leaf25]|uniref:putative bifunctional diguanylate cyclase/phosphodiesterase n=1 Tax=Sphingomonas sp. Leaf25 TaxID=1735692 RepID=UPI0006F8375F|nr:GGDEF domain-containing phosphodiesterase [Sphingomonas sp. Leaf25]KQN04059.1 diguanylate cyclase [Sphingomonas sp. Leaf25]